MFLVVPAACHVTSTSTTIRMSGDAFCSITKIPEKNNRCARCAALLGGCSENGPGGGAARLIANRSSRRASVIDPLLPPGGSCLQVIRARGGECSFEFGSIGRLINAACVTGELAQGLESIAFPAGPRELYLNGSKRIQVVGQFVPSRPGWQGRPIIQPNDSLEYIGGVDLHSF